MPGDMLSNTEVAAFAGDTRPSRRKGTGSKFLQQWTADSLDKALRCKGKAVNLDWIIKRLIDIAQNAFMVKDQLAAMDRLTEFIKLGAVQDTQLCAHVRSMRDKAQKTVAAQTRDPFEEMARKNLKLTKEAV